MLADLAVKLALAMPRGGYRLLAILSRLMPRLRRYPIALHVAPGVRMEANLAENVFFPLLKHGRYPHQVSEDMIITTFLRDGDCVLDIGANIGYFSALCAQCSSNGVVHAFEPSAIAFRYLKQVSIQIPQIRPWNLAVSNFTGKMRFVDEEMLDRSHVATDEDRRAYIVDSCTIDAWSASNGIDRIDFIKVDAEGHDVHVIEGSRRVIGARHPVVEFEAFDMATVGRVYDALRGLECSAAYRIYRCCNQYPLWQRGGANKTNNWFAIPHSRLRAFPDFLFRRGFLEPTHFERTK